MQNSLSAEGLYINEFHRENSMAAQRAVKQMSLHPYSLHRSFGDEIAGELKNPRNWTYATSDLTTEVSFYM